MYPREVNRRISNGECFYAESSYLIVKKARSKQNTVEVLTENGWIPVSRIRVSHQYFTVLPDARTEQGYQFT